MKQLLILMLALVYAGVFWWLEAGFQLSWLLVWWTLGLGSGVVALWLDEAWWYRYYQAEGTARLVITRSWWFCLLYFPLSLYVLSSSSSALGHGLVLGLGLGLSTEWWLYRRDPARLRALWLASLEQPDMRFTDTNIHRFVWIFIGGWALLSVLSLW